MSELKPCGCDDPYHECDERPGCKLGRAQPAITSETGNQAAQGASAITSVPEHPYLTPKGIAEQWTEKTVPLLTEAEMRNALQSTNHMVKNAMHGAFWPELEEACRAIESLVRSKLGAGVPMTDAQIAEFQEDGVFWQSCKHIVRDIEKFHGIVGKEGGK